MYTLEIEIIGLPNLQNKQLRGNWRSRYGINRDWKLKVIQAIAGRIPDEPLAKSKITLTRHSTQEPDYDGLVSSFKPIVDGLKAANVIIDDKPSCCQGIYQWKLAKVRQGKITVRVEAA